MEVDPNLNKEKSEEKQRSEVMRESNIFVS